MKYTLIASLLTSAAYAAPAPTFGQGGFGQGGLGQGAGLRGAGRLGQGQQGSALGGAGAGQNAALGAGGLNLPTGAGEDLPTAVTNWRADTSRVSNFLDIGKSIQNDAQFKAAANVAYLSEVNELEHKAVIDAANGNQPNVQGANSTLATGGSFQDVVDKLKIMRDQGKSAVNNIDLILQNRCVNVLPNIDEYFKSTGSQLKSVRPKACDQTGIRGGVQGNGPTRLGQAPGSPAAAFAAASALAAGTGNGRVNNAAFPVAGAAGGAGGLGAGQRKGALGRLGQGGAGAAAGAGASAGTGLGAGRLGGAGAGASTGSGLGAGRLGGAGGAATGGLGRFGLGQKGAAGGAAAGAAPAAGGLGRFGLGKSAGAAPGAGAGGLGRPGAGAGAGGFGRLGH